MVDFKAKMPKVNSSGSSLNVPEINPVAENGDHKNSVDAICASPILQGQYASGSHDKTIKLWNAQTGQCLKTMEGHENGVWCLNYFPDGKKLLSASSDGTSRIWDINSGKLTGTLGGHTGRVFYAMPNADGTMTTSVGSDRIINVWDMRNASKPLVQNKDSTDVIMSCDFSSDGKHVISGTMGGVINGLSLESNTLEMAYDTLEFQPERDPPIDSNMIYTLKSVHGHPSGGNKMLMGCEL